MSITYCPSRYVCEAYADNFINRKNVFYFLRGGLSFNVHFPFGQVFAVTRI
jgi:hypothetical protein